MKFKLLIPALSLIAFAQTSCRNVEQEQRQLLLDSLTVIRRVADSVEQITPFAGARFGSSAEDAVEAIDRFNRFNDYHIKYFKYDHIDPYYLDKGLMEIKIVGEEHNWSEYDSIYATMESCIEMFNDKYGDPLDIDTTIRLGRPHEESRFLGWVKGDKGISIRIISDYHRFLFEIDIWSEKMMKAYLRGIGDRSYS